jgi:hypothetical protein
VLVKLDLNITGASDSTTSYLIYYGVSRIDHNNLNDHVDNANSKKTKKWLY